MAPSAPQETRLGEAPFNSTTIVWGVSPMLVPECSWASSQRASDAANSTSSSLAPDPTRGGATLLVRDTAA